MYFFSGKIAVFTVLCEKYQTSINRDPAYKEVNKALIISKADDFSFTYIFFKENKVDISCELSVKQMIHRRAPVA